MFLNSYYDSDKLILSVEEIDIQDSKSMIQDISSHVEARIRKKPSEYYGNTGDSNQLWERKVFMSAKLDRFNNIKGFLHPDEGKFLYELSSEECRGEICCRNWIILW